MSHTIATGHGVDFNVLRPRAQDVKLEDLAAALGRVCRFGGHIDPTIEHYSVAQHSVHVAELVYRNAAPSRREELARVALLHDAAEAYVGDSVSPLKALLRDFKSLELRILAQIFVAHGIDAGVAFKMPEVVKWADAMAYEWERRDVAPLPEPLPNVHLLEHLPPLRPLSPFEARDAFLAMHRELFPQGLNR